MDDIISLAELRAELDLDPEEALAFAKRRSSDLPLWFHAPGCEVIYFHQSEPYDSDGREIRVRQIVDRGLMNKPMSLHPHWLVGFRDDVIVHQGTTDKRNRTLSPIPPDRRADVMIVEFTPPLRLTRSDLLLRRSDVRRWQAGVEARRRGGGRATELRLALGAALAGEPRFVLTTEDAAARVGVSYNTLRARRKASEALELPRPWSSMNPHAKRPTYRWLDNSVALNSWMELMEQVKGAVAEEKRPKPARRRTRRRAAAASSSALEAEQRLDDILDGLV